MMTDSNMQYYWKMLRDEKIILDYGDKKHFRVHPSFEPILNSYLLNRRYNMMESLTLAVQAYCPTASPMQSSVICNFMSEKIKETMPLVWEVLRMELAIDKIKNPPREEIPLEEAIKSIMEDEKYR